MSGMQLKIKKLREGAKLPYRASAGAAAYDLCACTSEPIRIEPGEYASVQTGIAIELPREDMVALVFSRSGHGIKHGLSLVNSVGVIDYDYRGEITVGLINHGTEPYEIAPGERIAQLMITSFFAPEVVECNELGETERGVAGFGSTGK